MTRMHWSSVARNGMAAALLAALTQSSMQLGCSNADSNVDFSPGASAGPSGGQGSGGSSATGGSYGDDIIGGGESDAGNPPAEGGETGGSMGGQSGGSAGTGNGGGRGGSLAGGGTDAGGGSAGNGGNAGSVSCEPQDEACDGLDNDCDEQIDEGSACAEGCTGSRFEGERYLFCSVSSTSQDQAAERCEDFDMQLVSIESEPENLYVVQNTLGIAWIGATDEQEGQWRWPDGTEFWRGGENGEPVAQRYNAWAAGQPDDPPALVEDCAVIIAGAWHDVPCAFGAQHFVCETP